MAAAWKEKVEAQQHERDAEKSSTRVDIPDGVIKRKKEEIFAPHPSTDRASSSGKHW